MMMKKSNKSIIDTLILALMLALFMIGAHQIYVIAQEEGFKNGFFKSYYIFMFIVILMAVYQIRKNKREREEQHISSQPPEKRQKSDHGIKKKNKAK
jgi:amino acid permease